ncbi:MAG: hypothetical protein HDR71_04050 [Lachnospiraceae bacterium]|nr:hypothetical protein [Lachnospiraceae bacterium]
MEYVDERIAMLEREKRRQKKEEEKKLCAANEERESTIRKMTLEEMLEKVREGEADLPDYGKHTFETRYYFEDRIPMVLIKSFYTGVQEDPGATIFVNHDQNVSQILTVSDKEMEKSSIGKWKKQLENGMRMSGTYAQVTKEIILENLDYLVFRTPTGKGWVYNLIFRIRYGSNRVVGNYNCFEKDKETYGLLLEALVHRLNELLSTPFKEPAEGESI